MLLNVFNYNFKIPDKYRKILLISPTPPPEYTPPTQICNPINILNKAPAPLVYTTHRI